MKTKTRKGERRRMEGKGKVNGKKGKKWKRSLEERGKGRWKGIKEGEVRGERGKNERKLIKSENNNSEGK